MWVKLARDRDLDSGLLEEWDIWKVGAWLGFWPLVPEDYMEGRKVPRFLKPLEILWYGDDENVKLHWRLNLSQNPNEALLTKSQWTSHLCHWAPPSAKHARRVPVRHLHTAS
jgi:hypothetical protein